MADRNRESRIVAATGLATGLGTSPWRKRDALFSPPQRPEEYLCGGMALPGFGLTAPGVAGGLAGLCGYYFLVYDVMNGVPPPPSGAEFKDAVMQNFPDRHYKFNTNHLFDTSSIPYLEGTIKGATRYDIWIMITASSQPVDGLFLVGYLEIHRQSSVDGYGWAPVRTFPLEFDGTENTIEVGGVYGYIFTACSDDANFDYLFRVVPAEGAADFTFHAGIAYLGFFI